MFNLLIRNFPELFVQSNRYLPLETVTIAEALKTAGYETASIGKWHLGSAADGRDAKAQGFDLDLGGKDTGSTETHWWPYKLPGLEEGSPGEYLTDRMTQETMNFIDRSKGSPWFAYLSFYAVHTPIEVNDYFCSRLLLFGVVWSCLLLFYSVLCCFCCCFIRFCFVFDVVCCCCLFLLLFYSFSCFGFLCFVFLCFSELFIVSCYWGCFLLMCSLFAPCVRFSNLFCLFC